MIAIQRPNPFSRATISLRSDDGILKLVTGRESHFYPFEYEIAGIEAEDIVDEFEFDDFDSHPIIMVSNRMHHLSEARYLNKVYPHRSSANAAYRLTRQGWDVVGRDEPETPLENLYQ